MSIPTDPATPEPAMELASDTVAETRQDRLQRGMGMLDRVVGEPGRQVIDSLADISPDLGHHIVAWAFGDIYSRPQLALRDRQLVTLGMLTALGGCEPQLDVHINAALNVGLSAEEIVEALLHSAVYCGMPKALNATAVAKKVFAEHGLLAGREKPGGTGQDVDGAGVHGSAVPGRGFRGRRSPARATADRPSENSAPGSGTSALGRSPHRR